MSVKLPLLARKNIRDEFTAKLPTLQEELKEYIGIDFDLNQDFQELYPKLDLSQSYQAESPGSTAYNVLEGFVYKIKRITEEGDRKDVIDFFNSVVSEHKVKLVVEDYHTYCGCRIVDGVLEIVFKTGNFGTNASYTCDNLEKEMDIAYAANNKGELPLAATRGIADDFEAKREALEKEISEELLGAKVNLSFDPKQIWTVANEEYDKLKKSQKSDIDLDRIASSMGSAVYAYFSDFLSMLKYKFKQDDMMVEAFTDACPNGEIKVKLVPKEPNVLTKSYNDAVFEDGALVIRTTPQNWYTNTYDATQDVEKLL